MLLFTWCHLASYVVIFPIRCGSLRDKVNRLNRNGSGK